jgi:cysteine-rich repeat protein
MWGGNEQCDDGNAVSGDGCSALCQLEPSYVCDFLGQPCEAVVCGDGRQHSYMLTDGTWVYEACDDSNTNSGDGCSSACVLEPGWICDGPDQDCRKITCGDGHQDSWFEPGPGGGTPGSGGFGGGSSDSYHYEECDDGNAASGDGCSSTCTLEDGWVCPEPDTACHQPTCGDGFIDFIPGRPGGSGGFGGSGSVGSGGFGTGGGAVSGSYEECDDLNTTSGDGCDASCSVEPGWACPYWLSASCHPIACGDGFVDYPSESCEDGNTTPHDGCTNCQYDFQGGGGAGGFGPQPSGGFGGG